MPFLIRTLRKRPKEDEESTSYTAEALQVASTTFLKDGPNRRHCPVCNVHCWCCQGCCERAASEDENADEDAVGAFSGYDYDVLTATGVFLRIFGLSQGVSSTALRLAKCTQIIRTNISESFSKCTHTIRSNISESFFSPYFPTNVVWSIRKRVLLRPSLLTRNTRSSDGATFSYQSLILRVRLLRFFC